MRTIHGMETLLAREISARLTVEYAGAVPPGRVLAETIRVARRLRGVSLDPESRRTLIEHSVRQQLVAQSRTDQLS